MRYFSSIYIGSYAISMKIFEIKDDGTYRELDNMRYPIASIMDIFDKGSISVDRTREICNVLNDMKVTMDSYGVDDYTLAIGSMLHEAENEMFLVDQIRLRVGLNPTRLTNSEQRFFEYEAVASSENFDKMIQEGALMVDFGGASLQLTLFKNGAVKTTQHLDLGTFKMYMTMQRLKNVHNRMEQIKDVVDKELDTFLNMYFPEKHIPNLIVMADKSIRSSKKLKNGVPYKSDEVRSILLKEWEAKMNNEGTVFSSLERAMYILTSELIAMIPADEVHLPAVAINDGIMLDYLYREKLCVPKHDFQKDVISAAYSLAERYGSYFPHIEVLDNLSCKIFDIMCDSNGMDDRMRLMLRVSVILHDCGKYISISEASNNSFRIILSSEILGLTHKERQMVACVAQYNRKDLPNYKELSSMFTRKQYWNIAKMVAILRVANALDRSHKQRLKDVKLSIADRELIIGVNEESSIALERGLFKEKADFFENIFSIRPVIREVK